MHIPLEQFDISAYDSTSVHNDTPKFLMSKLVLSLQNPTDSIISIDSSADTELKLRAILDILVHQGLTRKTSSMAGIKNPDSVLLPMLEHVVLERKQGLEQAIIQKKFVLFAPNLCTPKAVEKFTNQLNALLDKTNSAKIWILDLSLVSQIPFELFGYLIGLKQILSRLNIELNLLWLKQDAVPIEFLDSIKQNFNLFSKGVFLLSK